MSEDAGVAALVAGLAAAGVVLLARPWPPRGPLGPGPPAARAPSGDLLRRGRWWWAVCAGGGAAVVVPGPLGPVAGLAAAYGVWRLAGSAEPASARRAEEAARRDLAMLVDLLAGALAAGAAPQRAVAVVCDAFPGAAADRLAGVGVRLGLGVDPVAVWDDLADDPVLAPLGRALGRAQTSGASVADAVAGLADDLSGRDRAEVEDRARAVGVRAALPLGLCLLPAFLVLGVVPMVAGMLAGLLG